MRVNSNKNMRFIAVALVLGVSAPVLAQEIDLGDFDEVNVEGAVKGEIDNTTKGIKVVSGTGAAKSELVLGESDIERPEVKGRVGYIDKRKPLKKDSKSYACTGRKGLSISERHVEGENNVTVQGSCGIKIKNAKLSSTSTNVLIQGSGAVKITKSTLRSEDVGIAIQGSGDVYLTDVDLEADVADRKSVV